MQTEQEYNKNYTTYQAERGKLRHWLRIPYLNNILKYVKGKTVDFGCGTGRLLSLLPQGSIGLEINPDSVDFCKKIGLNVLHYNAVEDSFSLSLLDSGIYKTFTMIHVLEHLDNPSEAFEKISAACKRLLINRIILKVPGKKGFNFDNTHKTFIDMNFISENGMTYINDYQLVKSFHFPINIKSFGNYFTHNELTLIYDRVSKHE